MATGMLMAAKGPLICQGLQKPLSVCKGHEKKKKKELLGRNSGGETNT